MFRARLVPSVISTLRLSRLTLPLSVVSNLYIMVLLPAFNETVSEATAHVFQSAVAGS
ncbi:hypothetical protein D3C75_1264680 [compost metagenome]